MKTTVAVFALTLALSFGRLAAQVPIDIVSPNDTTASRFVDALKQAVLGSSSFLLTTSGPRLRVTPVVGGSIGITCGEHHDEVRGVALFMTDSSGNKQVVYTSVFEVGKEKETANRQLLRVYESASRMGIRGRAR